MTGCRPGVCDHSRSKAAMRMWANPCVTEAEWRFGESAQYFGEWQSRFGRANIGLAQRLLVCPRRGETARKTLRQGKAVPTVNRLLRVTVGCFAIVTKPGCRNGAASWAEWSGVPFGRAGRLGASQSSGLRRQARWLKVWRGGGGKFQRDGTSTQAEWRPG